MTILRLVRRRLPHSTSKRWVVAAAIATAALALSSATAIRPGAVAATSAPTCGTTRVARSSGGYWSCTFADEFSGSRLDTTKWQPYTSVRGGFHGGDECYSPSNVTLDSGNLRLTATKSTTTFDCAGTPSTYRSGLIMSKGLFAQAYGRFEMRAMIPAGVGFQPAFWLLPENPYIQPGGYAYGEIDVMESWGTYPDIASPHLHFVQTPGYPNSGAYCHVANMATAYHTYTVEWTRLRMTFKYDGNVCWSTNWNPIPTYQPEGAKAPSPFNQPFYLIVNLAMGGASTPTNRATSTTQFPSRMSVDYIRVWK
ncbi:MAG TPA: glycoside hydrolase family 16 protein [Jatrophihabitantaceae bacterium]|nr:glycoside hydrolase family 16 protein [Jatrophihabitantaceae bacterium]